MNDEPLTAMLTALESPAQLGSAWREFVTKYSPLIMHVVRKHESRRERVHDCFVYVCSALSEDDFRRLRAFRPERQVRFTTWLMAIVSNLCIDWRRKEDGRKRPWRAVARLSSLEQSVFRHIFVRGFSRTECLQMLRPQFPELTESGIAEINARLFGLLTPEQRFLLGSRLAPVFPGMSDIDDVGAGSAVDLSSGPARLAEEREDSKRLKAALAQLPAEQRLLLKMRFEQDLTLAEIARLTRLPDPFRVDRQIRSALLTLQRLLEEQPGGRKNR